MVRNDQDFSIFSAFSIVYEMFYLSVKNFSFITVTNALEGQITLSNAEYKDEYNNQNSPIYKNFIKDLENEIKKALTVMPDEQFFVKIIDLK